MRPFHVYMLRCADGAFYVGHTDDLDRRIAQHQHGELPGFTRERRPVELVFSSEHQDRDEAFARERQLKGWSRAKKEALARGDFASVPGLARSRAARASTGSARAERVKRHGSEIHPSARAERAEGHGSEIHPSARAERANRHGSEDPPSARVGGVDGRDSRAVPHA